MHGQSNDDYQLYLSIDEGKLFKFPLADSTATLKSDGPNISLQYCYHICDESLIIRVQNSNYFVIVSGEREIIKVNINYLLRGKIRIKLEKKETRADTILQLNDTRVILDDI